MTSSDGENQQLRCLVRGRVQGVGFRAFVVSQANHLGLTGWARNLSDGCTVEVVAEGTTEELERLMRALRKGPAGSNVIAVEPTFRAATGDFVDFRIGY